MENARHRLVGERTDALSERVCVIVNPAAGRGRGAKSLPAIQASFAALGVTEVRVTRSSHEERTMAAEAIGRGFTTIVAAGGDGTSGNVANAILAANTRTRLGVIPVGTGNDFAKTLRVRDLSIEAIARLSVESSSAAVDVGRVEDNFFLNSCGFGFDVAVLKSLAGKRWLKGNAVYLYSALTQLFGFAGFEAEIESASVVSRRNRYMMIVIANCPHFGGAFLIAPGADVLDGQLDAVCVRNVTGLRRLHLLAAAARGTHPDFAEVTVERAGEFTLHFDDVPDYETDGEVHRAVSSSVRIQCISRGLRVVTGDGFGREHRS